MDTFVDSSWYFLRYPNTHYEGGPFDPVAVKQWMPVDHYIGGIEHAILHLLYARFITKALHDHAGLCQCQRINYQLSCPKMSSLSRPVNRRCLKLMSL